jgi:uncharacterized coiled-coil DUF342 family protein
MALEEKRLAKNIANRKNEHTAKNKFLKTKPKIQEMKQNVDEAMREAADFHDYIKRAEVVMGPSPDVSTSGVQPMTGVPLIEKDSFTPLIELLIGMFANLGNNIYTTPQQKETLIQTFQDGLELGITITNAGHRYLTTRARANQLGGTFQPVTNEMASQLKKNSGKGRII